jgi:hypothetical protein
MSTEIEQGPCPVCGSTSGTVTCVTEPASKIPKGGDLTLCFKCAAPLIFTENLGRRPLTHADVLTLDAAMVTKLWIVQRTILRLRHELN